MRQHTIPTPYLIGEVHCYSTEIDGELLLFDSGPPTAAALASLKSQVDLSRLKYLFLTHGHIDHSGLATLVAEHSDATILIPRADARKLSRYSETLEHLKTLLVELGCPRAMAESVCEKSEAESRVQLWPGKCQIVEESDLPFKLGMRWLSCPGHSQSDLVYLCGKHAVTGDILLRNIFQVPILEVDLQTFEGRFHNYNAYCASLESLAQLRDFMIHPGHRRHIESVDSTILFYVTKLLKLAGRIKAVPLDQPAFGIMEAVFEKLPDIPFFLHMKLSETVFALDFLASPNTLKTALEAIGLFDKVREPFCAVSEHGQEMFA